MQVYAIQVDKFMKYLFFVAIQTELLSILSFHVFTVLQHCTDFIIYTCLLYSRESAILVIDETFFSQPFSIKHWWLTQTVLNNEVKSYMKSCLINKQKNDSLDLIKKGKNACFMSRHQCFGCVGRLFAKYQQSKKYKKATLKGKNEVLCLNQCWFFCETS